MSQRVLIIDDDLELLALLQQWLELEGFTVGTAQGGMEGIQKADGFCPDLIILDIMMPGMDGWTTYQELRHICATPIIILTAMAGRDSVIKGLDMGAEGYLTKPYTLKELRVRIHEALEQASTDARLVLFDDGHLRVDLMDGASVQNRGDIDFSPTESRLLRYLARRSGECIPYDELLINIWGSEYAGEVSYLNTYMRYLCQKIEDDPANPRYIHDQHGVGYCFTHPPGLATAA